ncbi:alpha/beta fold hydrolase [Lacimicrobium alkaliphilum]|uniref:Lysophospholipase n=1 Tax=Lacimicrobium alkaliphilum TaxID=1526571 RepID=A0A0U3B435_9ALTE|nr:alpha/beta fold hydrolase [Lacimicrobium alkaliphilum]ALS99976.1 lysophospholipase [Lacimicrobium alkaliphilum]
MNFYLSEESELEQRYDSLIQGFWHNQVSTGSFAGVDNINIAYACALHPQARGSVVISSGRIEGYLKYKEIIFELYQNHYSVFILDHRGQGLSGRMTPQVHQGYVADFSDYVTDLKTFYDQVVMPQSSHKPLLLGHSMGGAIGTLYLNRYPQDFDKAVFTAPMYGIRLPLPKWLVKALLSAGLTLNQWVGKRPWYFFGQTDYLAIPFAINPLTHSKVRYRIFRQEYETHPAMKLGGVTYNWLRAAIRATEQLEQQVSEVQTPILVLQAGGDQIIDNEAQDHLCAMMPRCQLKPVSGARHELLMEADRYRQPSMQAILAFFEPQKQDPDE